MTTAGHRVAAALNGKVIDRIPVFSTMRSQDAKELGLPLRKYYSKGEYIAESQFRLRPKYGYDNLRSLI